MAAPEPTAPFPALTVTLTCCYSGKHPFRNNRRATASDIFGERIKCPGIAVHVDVLRRHLDLLVVGDKQRLHSVSLTQTWRPSMWLYFSNGNKTSPLFNMNQNIVPLRSINQAKWGRASCAVKSLSRPLSLSSSLVKLGAPSHTLQPPSEHGQHKHVVSTIYQYVLFSGLLRTSHSFRLCASLRKPGAW